MEHILKTVGLETFCLLYKFPLVVIESHLVSENSQYKDQRTCFVENQNFFPFIQTYFFNLFVLDYSVPFPFRVRIAQNQFSFFTRYFVGVR